MMISRACFALAFAAFSVACSSSSSRGEDSPSTNSAVVTSGSPLGRSGEEGGGTMFELQNGNGIGARFEITTSTATSITFNLTALTSGGSGHNGVIDGGVAALVGDTAHYSAGPDCLIDFDFDAEHFEADVRQTGTCEDGAGFGAFVDVSGHYVAK